VHAVERADPTRPPPIAAARPQVPLDCTYFRDQPIDGGDRGYLINPTSVDTSEFKTGDNVNVLCRNATTGEYFNPYHTVWGTNGATAPNPDQLARQALDGIQFASAQVESWPKTTDIVAGVKTYFHVKNWDTLTRNATADTNPGGPGVHTDLTAKPARTIWHISNPTTGKPVVLECAGPGTQWTPGMSDHDPSLCGTTLWTKGDITATVEVLYDVTWTSNIGPGGPLTAPPQPTQFPLHVRDFQAVIR
jgi:hypothetical protein